MKKILIAVLVIASLAAAGTVATFFYIHYQTEAEKKELILAQRSDLEKIIAEHQKLYSDLKIGLNLLDYTAQLRNVNRLMTDFSEKYSTLGQQEDKAKGLLWDAMDDLIYVKDNWTIDGIGEHYPGGPHTEVIDKKYPKVLNIARKMSREELISKFPTLYADLPQSVQMEIYISRNEFFSVIWEYAHQKVVEAQEILKRHSAP